MVILSLSNTVLIACLSAFGKLNLLDDGALSNSFNISLWVKFLYESKFWSCELGGVYPVLCFSMVGLSFVEVVFLSIKKYFNLRF